MGNLRTGGLYFILVILVIALAWFSCNQYNKIKQESEQLQDTALNRVATDRIFVVDAKTARILTLTTEKDELFTKMKFQDAMIDSLQGIVKQYSNKLRAGSSVTRTNVSTSLLKTTKTEVIQDVEDTLAMQTLRRFDSISGITRDEWGAIIHVDTSNSLSFKTREAKWRLYPTYITEYSDKWIDYKIAATFDSTKLDLKVNNEYATVVGYDKGKAFADVINFNPYSKTTSTRTYQVELPKPKKFGLGFSFGGTWINGKPQPYIGAGINYNPIRF